MRRTMAPSRKVGEQNIKVAKIDSNSEKLWINEDKIEVEDAITEFRYFSVAYGKPSKKKHKLWDGDGILTLSDRSVILQDSEGKELGSTLRKQLSQIVFEEGATLHVAGKYVEILSTVTKPNLKSSVAVNIIQKDKLTTTSYINHEFRPVVKTEISNDTVINGSADSVIFPRPSADHIFRNNQHGSLITDVILDPLFSTRMRPHQIDGVIFLYECVLGLRNHNGTGAILADAMGLGKSVQSIALIWTLLNQGPYDSQPLIRRCLIVCPCSLVLNWKAEFQKWLGIRIFEPFFVAGDCRIEKYVSAPKSPILVVSYETMTKYQKVINELAFDMIICDEAHRLKNSNIKASLGIESLSISKRVLLTGTPLQNDMDELYALSDVCIPGILGESKDVFRKRFVEPISKAREPQASETLLDQGLEASMELERMTKSFMLRRTETVNVDYLPPKDDLILFCRPTDMQLTLYRLLLESHVEQRQSQLTEDASFNGGDALSCISMLRKICNDPSLFVKYIIDKENNQSKQNEDHSLQSEIHRKLLCLANESEVWSKFVHSSGSSHCSEIYSGKLWVTAEMILALKPLDKIVIASHFTKTLDILQRLCEGLCMKIYRIDGSTATVARMKTVVEFNIAKTNINSKPEVLLLSCKAGGEGLNLVGASRILLYDLDWNPAIDAQTLARIWRDGQKKRVAIYRLVTTGTVEESVLQRQVSKDQLSDTCVDRSRKAANSTTNFSAQELKNIFTLHTDFMDGSWTHQLLSCECQQTAKINDDTVRCVTPPRDVNPLCQLGLRKTPQKQRNSSCIAHLSSWTHWINQEQIRSYCTDNLILNAVDQITSVFHRTVSGSKDDEIIK